MSRITYELGFKGSGEYNTDNTKDMPANNFIKALNKLGQLEDKEEEFGVDLIKLLSARKVYYIDWSGNGDDFKIRKTYRLLINLTERTIEFYRDELSEFPFVLYPKDYGKKDVYGGWAFTKEELE